MVSRVRLYWYAILAYLFYFTNSSVSRYIEVKGYTSSLLKVMDKVQSRYLSITKKFMCILGQWPHQTRLQRILISSVFIPNFMLQIILQGCAVTEALVYNNMSIFFEGCAPFLISLMCVVKYFNFLSNHKQMKKLLEMMEEDWKIYSKSSAEHEILCEKYAVGKKVAIYYAVVIYGSMIPFMITPTILNIADAIGVYNMTGERPIMFPVGQFVDMDKYYYLILMHGYPGTIGFIAIVVALDSMVVFYVQHECGICEILGYRNVPFAPAITHANTQLFRRRLKDLTDEDNMDVELHPDQSEDRAYQNARSCVLIHQHIIRFAKFLEDANTMSSIFQLGLTMLGISITGYQVVVTMAHPKDAVSQAAFTVCQLTLVLLLSWPGQQLMDHTESIFQFTTNGKWYQSSIKTRKLLSVMLLRSSQPIKLTAGKLYTLDLMNFSAVVRTSFSYFMVLCSLE